MTEPEVHETDSFPVDADAPKPARPPLPRWKKVLLLLAGVCVVVGVLLLIFEDAGAPSTSGSGARTPPGGAGLAPDGVGRAELPQAGQDDGMAWSPLFLKMGFSFFVGFAIGYVFRTFLKLSLLGAGVIALALFGLQQAGLVEVHWDKMSDMFDSVMGHVREQASGFKTLLTGSLPAAGLGGLGLFTGFRKG